MEKVIDEDYSAVWQSCFEGPKNNSLRKENIKVQKKKGKYEVKLTAIVLAGLLTVGAVKGINSIKVKNGIVEGTAVEEMTEEDSIFNSISEYFSRNDKDSELNMDNLAKEIGSLVFVKPSDFNEKYDTTKVSIIAQCTHRTNDNNGYFYDVDDMARKTVELGERELIEYAMVANLKSMKNNGTIDNPVQALGKTNADSYLEACKREAKSKGMELDFSSDLEGFIKDRNCKTLEEVVEQENKKAEYVKEVVMQEQNDRGIEEEGVKKNA